ncbi:MAG: hypothetical protein HYX69_20585 [Planctomycetia bacterium]|nr:hypothetical protein [Planctomycetia bacterium]
MLSTITWTNRGNSSDGFDAVFGPAAAAARADADAAFATWSRVVANFNNGSNNINISLSIAGTGIGGSGGVSTISDGRPTSGTINLAGGTNGLGGGYFIDPTPYDSSEFDGNITNAFAGNAKAGTDAAGKLDFYTLVMLETTHVLGTSKNPSLRIWTSGLLSNTNIAIPTGREEAGPGAGGLNNTYWLFNGASGRVLFNGSANTGNPADLYNAVHTGSTTNPPVVYNGSTYYGGEDAGNGFWNKGERYVPSRNVARVFQDAYGYTINEPSQFGTFYDRLDASGTLEIRTPAGNSPDTLDLQISGGNLLVTLGLGAPVPGADPSSILSVLPINSINNIKIDMGGGSDTVTIHSLYGSIPIALNLGSGAGYDVLNVWGGAGYDAITVNSPSLVSTGINLTSFDGVESLNLFLNGGDADVYMPNAGSALVASINGLGGPEYITLHSLWLFTSLAIYGNGGDDTISIAPNGGTNIIQAPVTVSGGGGSDRLIVGGGNLDSVTGLITYDGVDNASGDSVTLNDQSNSFSLNYNLAATSLTRDKPLSFGGLNYSNISRIILNATLGPNNFILANDILPTVEIHANDGDDNFIVGAGNVGFIPAWILDGGSGNDAITFDNHLLASNHTVEIQPNLVIFYNGVFAISTVGFESVGWLGGSGNDQIRMSGNLAQGINVDAGLGNDTIVVGYSSQAQFFGNVTINGAAGNDNISWNRASNNWYELIFGPVKYDVTIDGGTGYNTLAIDETTRSAAGYYLYADRFYATDGAVFPEGFDINYDNMQAMSLSAGSGTTNVGVYGTSSDIDVGNQISIALGGGNDNVYLYPHDAQGNLTINGNVGIGGGAGTDSLFVVDSASPVPAAYAFANPFGAGTQNITGVGSGGFGIASDFEAITMTGSAGDDVYNINSYKSGMGLTINGGLGDDLCNFGNGDVAANVTSIASFLFNGEQGIDTFNLRNANPANSFTYTAAANTTLQVSRTFPTSYFVSLEYYNTEQKAVYAGPAVDIMNITSFASGEFSFHGAGGDDALNLPTSSDLLGRRVNFFGDAGTANRINQVTNSKTAPSTLHVSQNTIGAFAGDNFFAPGGSVFFDSVQIIGLRMGSGADTAYMQPDAVAAISIVGGNPTAAPGDTLNLALATAQNYVVNGSPASGNVTSDNLKTLTYSGFETGPNVDAVAPFIVAQSYDDSGLVPTIFVEFSEDVSSALTVDFLELINTTTAQQVPPGLMAVTYDAGTNTASFTFPGYTDGILPAGDYTAKIYGTLTDSVGNPMGVETPFGFTVSPVVTTGPRVTGVWVASNAWQPTFYTQLEDNNLGTVNGYAIPGGADQLKTLPWFRPGTNQGLDRISLQFDSNVDVQQSDLVVNGVTLPEYSFLPVDGGGFSYDDTTFTATWTLSQPIGTDNLTLHLDGDSASGVRDLSGHLLDGEWTDQVSNFASGNGVAGGGFDFQFKVLPASVNGDGIVDISDIQAIAVHWLQAFPPADINADGLVDISDIQLVAARWLTTGPGAGSGTQLGGGGGAGSEAALGGGSGGGTLEAAFAFAAPRALFDATTSPSAAAPPAADLATPVAPGKATNGVAQSDTVMAAVQAPPLVSTSRIGSNAVTLDAEPSPASRIGGVGERGSLSARDLSIASARATDAVLGGGRLTRASTDTRRLTTDGDRSSATPAIDALIANYEWDSPHDGASEELAAGLFRRLSAGRGARA